MLHRTLLSRLLASLVILTAVPAFATNRTLTIVAPKTVPAGAWVQVKIMAQTDATDDEQIGFFQAEYSTDSGKTWVPVYSEKQGRSMTRVINLNAGAADSQCRVRVRVAFRGGNAGDVDFSGGPIAWGASWSKWTTPPAKSATIEVIAR